MSSQKQKNRRVEVGGGVHPSSLLTTALAHRVPVLDLLMVRVREQTESNTESFIYLRCNGSL